MATERLPRPRPGRSVRVRILASILVTTTIGLVAAGLVSYGLQRAATMREVDARLASELTEARRVVSAQSGVASTRDAVRQVLSVAVPPEDGGTVGLVGGRVAFTAGVAEAVHPEGIAGFAARVTRETADGTVRQGTVVSGGRAYRYVAVPVRVQGDPAHGVVAVAIDLGLRLQAVDGTFRAYAVIAAISIVVIGAIGWLIAGRLLAPIRHLNAMAQRISADDLHERIPVTGDDDVSTLTATVNSMLDRIETGVQQRRALLDDVRHELKAPLSVVRGELELLDSGDPRVVADARRIGMEEVDRMTALVDGLTDLTDVQTSTLALAPVDLGSLTDDLLARAATMSGHPWSVARRAAAVVLLDRERVIQAWLQLADNAAKYAPDGSPIALGSTLSGAEVLLSVSDHGAPIPLAERDRIFERFARGRDAGPRGGSGLGLAIVAAIAAAHGGRVTLESEAGGNTFVMRLPARTPGRV